jgi:hypothetical protein
MKPQLRKEAIDAIQYFIESNHFVEQKEIEQGKKILERLWKDDAQVEDIEYIVEAILIFREFGYKERIPK